MKSLIFGGAITKSLRDEQAAAFGVQPAGGGIIDASIGWSKANWVSQRLAQDRAEGRELSVAWMHMTAPKLKQLASLDALVNHPDTLAYTNLLNSHCELGGAVIVDLMDELKQYAKWGPAKYVQVYDQIAARFHTNVLTIWSKGTMLVDPNMHFLDWRPSLARFRGVHLHGDTVFPWTAIGQDTQRFLDETAGMDLAIGDGGWIGRTPPLQTDAFIGDIRGAHDTVDGHDVGSVAWLKALVLILEQYEAVFSVAPHNVADWAVAPTPDGEKRWRSGRFVAGPHMTQDDPPQDSPWPGCPEFCAVLGKYLKTPRVLMHGDPLLKVALAGMAVKP